MTVIVRPEVLRARRSRVALKRNSQTQFFLPSKQSRPYGWAIVSVLRHQIQAWISTPEDHDPLKIGRPW